MVVAPVRSVLQPQLKGLGDLEPLTLAPGDSAELVNEAVAENKAHGLKRGGIGVAAASSRFRKRSEYARNYKMFASSHVNVPLRYPCGFPN